MPDVLRYCSKSSGLLIAMLLGSTLLGGCTHTSQNIFAAKTPAIESGQKDDQTVVGTVEATTGDDTVIETAKPALVYDQPAQSSWCRYLKNNAAAEAEIVASPTLSANSDDAGNGTVNIGMNLLDFKKADLIRKSADAKCQAYAAGKLLDGALRLSEEATKLAANLARQSYIEARQGEMEKVVARARALTASGTLTVQQANAISQLRHDLLAEMNTAKSEVDKRRNLPAIENDQLWGQNVALMDATSNLQEIDREIRTIDAFDVSLQAGYRFNEGDEFIGNQDDVYAKVKVGIRLGAVSARRSHYEEVAAEARLQALAEEGSGPIWKTGFAQEAIRGTLSGLKQARTSLLAARTNANDTAGKLNGTDRPELVYSALQAKIASVKLGADIAAVEASIREMENSMARLGALEK